MRDLINGGKAAEHLHSVNLTIKTKAPAKWVLIDSETGQVYRGADKATAYGPWTWVNNECKIPEDIKLILTRVNPTV
jgi:hypothetical protein